jgi:hypothetical protein
MKIYDLLFLMLFKCTVVITIESSFLYTEDHIIIIIFVLSFYFMDKINPQ